MGAQNASSFRTVQTPGEALKLALHSRQGDGSRGGRGCPLGPELTRRQENLGMLQARLFRVRAAGAGTSGTWEEVLSKLTVAEGGRKQNGGEPRGDPECELQKLLDGLNP